MTIFILNLIIISLYLILKTKTNLHMLQQNFYNENNRYLKWLTKNKKVVNYDVIILPLLLLTLIVNKRTFTVLMAVFYLVCLIIYIIKAKQEQVKIPLKYTSRIFRLSTTITGIYLISLILLLICYNNNNIAVNYLILGLLISLNSIVVYIANIINSPIEKMVYLGFKHQAQKKLKELSQLDVIGITGSYGKTSSKNILNDILKEKFNPIATPKNFNTQYGLIITINNYIDKFNDLFIAEMGAFTTGRIKLLCDFVHPKYGILTKIGTAHLETFGSQKNIQKTKFELIESLPKDGIGILNIDDELQTSYKLKNKCKIVWIGIDNKKADIYAHNVKCSNKGMQFDCYFTKEKKSYTFETKLLGTANIYNILAAIALGYELGMSTKQLQLGVKKVKTIEHRLELKKYNDVTLIDDAYNSNPVGSKMALDVLNLMPGKKIVVTPGMIELGDQEYKLNKEFGKQISQVADEVILVGKIQTKAIQEGLKEKKYNEKNIKIINDVKEAFALINNEKNAYVLLENDLPDTFNERK